MSWDDDDREYSNGADGSCHECGDPTDEPHHVLCASCYAEENGWDTARPAWKADPSAIAQQHEDRQHVTQLRMVELLVSLERRLEELHERLVALELRAAA